MVATPGKISPTNRSPPLASLISMLCGIPASLFSNLIVNGVSDGTCSSAITNWMLSALSSTTVPEARRATRSRRAIRSRRGWALAAVNSSVQQAGNGVEPGAGA